MKHWKGYLAIFLFVVIPIAVFTYWNLQSSKVLDITGDVTVRPPTIILDGDQIQSTEVTIPFCKRQDVQGRVAISLTKEGSNASIPPRIVYAYDETLKPQCLTAPQQLNIPGGILPGKYMWHYRIVYQLNPVKSTIKEFDSEPFEVK